MEIGPYVLPGLALLILISLVFVTAVWVFDGTRPEGDTDVLDDEEKDVDHRGPPKGPLARF